MKALIFQNKVVDLQEKEFPCSPEMTWIDCDDLDTKIGYGYSEGEYTNPNPEKPIDEQLKAQRDNALSESDWKMMRANESGEKVDEWNIDNIYIDSAAQQVKADFAYDYDIYCENAIKSVNDGISALQVLIEQDNLFFDLLLLYRPVLFYIQEEI